MNATKSFWIIGGILLLGLISRFFYIWTGDENVANFSGIGALALFSGTYLKSHWRWTLPFLLMWVSDLILNNFYYAAFYDSFQWFGVTSVYISFALIIGFAFFYLQQPSWAKVLIASFVSAVAFFVITNAAVWIGATSPYTKDWAGLVLCFEMAIPFFRNTLLGNLIYSALFFGLYEWAASRNSSVPSVVTRFV